MSVWNRYRLAIVFGLVGLGMAPLTALYFKNLWSQTHYQFFPVLLVAVAMLFVSRWKGDEDTTAAEPFAVPANPDEEGPPAKLWARIRPLVALAIVGLGVVIEFAAIWAFPTVTPWGGYFGLLVAGFGVVLYVGAGRPVSLIPVWALMALILLPPENADDQLITFLQQRTASYTSQFLDFLGVDHVREGVVIEIASKKLFVEEACSGVQSLFSLLAIAAVLAVWYSRSLAHTALLFVAAIAGAGAINVLRTVTIVYGLDKVGVDLLGEPQHSILGMIVFLFALGWLVCCDAFLTFLIGPLDSPDAIESDNFWIVLWNRLIAGFRWETEPAPLPRSGPTMKLLSTTALVALAVSGGTLAIASTKAVIASQRPGANPVLAPVDEGKVIGTLGSLQEDFLPVNFDGWEQTRFEVVKRSESNALGEHSRMWVYSTPFGIATLSVDYPFRGWHDLKTCYEGTGWSTSEVLTSQTAGGHGIYDVTQFTLRKYSGESALVVFAAMNEKLKPVPTREGGGATQTFVDKIQKALRATDSMEVIAQFQILAQPARRLTEKDVEEIHRHLNDFRARLVEHVRANAEVSP